jgi:pimeloyl-ACP methyl ester carboxylesterase
MFVGIDGTGPTDDKEYEQAMSKSFVKQLYDELNTRQPPGWYHRGPTLLSMAALGFGSLKDGSWGLTLSQVRDLAEMAVKVIKEHADEPGPIVLAGYSRGGAAAIQTARMLSKLVPDLKIDALALFDAVDRDLRADVTTIPGNVVMAYHAMRDPEIGSRWYFGNCGTSIEQPGTLFSLKFQATHAAMGGVPWTGDHPLRPVPAPGFESGRGAVWGVGGAAMPPMVWVPTTTEAADIKASQDVHDWMWGYLRNHVPLA